MTTPDLPPESWAQLEARQPLVRWRVVVLCFAAIGLCLGCVNAALTQPYLWRALDRSAMARYSRDDPIAVHLPHNLSSPADVADGVVVVGPSAVYYGVPPERADELMGEPAWTITLPGCNPPMFLAMAPAIVRAQPRAVVIVLVVQSAGTTSNAPGAAETRAAYIGPLNPAWDLRRELDGVGWRDYPGTMPLVRYRAPLRQLVGAWAEARRRGVQPEMPAWRMADVRRTWPNVSAALERFMRERTPEAYLAYRMAQGGVNPEVRDLVAEMRQVDIDMDGSSANLRALKRMTDYLRARGIRVAWMLFPENAVYGELKTRKGEPIAPAEARPLARESFARFAEASAVPFFDLLDLLPPEDFIDLFHVAEPGRQKLMPHFRKAAQQAA